MATKLLVLEKKSSIERVCEAGKGFSLFLLSSLLLRRGGSCCGGKMRSDDDEIISGICAHWWCA